jgi:hypothetical protein
VTCGKEVNPNYTETLRVKRGLEVTRCKRADDAFWLYVTDSFVCRIRTSGIRFRQHRHKATLTTGLQIYIYTHTYTYRVSNELRSLLRESVPYVKIYRYNPKHLCPKLNGYGDNDQRKVLSSGGSTHCTCQLTVSCNCAIDCSVRLQKYRFRCPSTLPLS